MTSKALSLNAQFKLSLMLKTTSLTPEIKEIVFNKGTEYCYSGIYDNFIIDGTYLCRNCGLAIFSSKDKFYSGSGWPSFDREIKNSINKVTDIDDVRTELLCNTPVRDKHYVNI